MQQRMILSVLAAMFAPAWADTTPLTTLDTVTVTATRQTQRVNESLADVSVIEREEIEQAGQSSLAELLAREPGVEFVSNGSPGAQTDILIRGTNTNHTILLIDGVRAGSATQGTASWSRIPSSQIERIEILRGPASSLYGSDAIGGVIQVFTRKGKGPVHVNAEAGYGSYDTKSGSAGVSGERDGLRYSLNVASYRTEGFSSVWNPNKSSYNPDKDSSHNESATAALSYAPAKGHEFGLNVFYSDGENKYDSSSGVNALRDYVGVVTVQEGSVYTKNALTSDWTSTLRAGRSTDDSTNYRDAVRTAIFRTDQDQVSWQHDVRLPVGTALFAWEYLDQSIQSTTQYPVSRRKIESWLAGWSAKIDQHQLQVNVRRDDNSQFGSKDTGAVAYGYQIHPQWRARVSYGTAFRAPTFNQLYFPNFGNANLKPEYARNREAAVYYDDGQHRVSVTWFRNDISDLIPTSQAINIGSARIVGTSIAYEGSGLGLDWQASVDHQDPRDMSSDKLLPRRARDFAKMSVGQWNDNWDWRVETLFSGKRFDDTSNNVKLGGYTLVNLYGSYRFDRDWSVFARINNVFDKKYELVADFATPGANIFVGVRYAPR